MQNLHFLGINWIDRKPYLKYRKNQNILLEENFLLETGNYLSIQISGEKYCTGYHDPSTGMDNICPDNRQVYKSDLYQCYKCRSFETTNFFSLSGLAEKQKEILRKKEYVNYLNLFGREIIKIGVSTTGNKWRRVLEQAADSTLFFTQTDGVTAREIENFVSSNFKIRQAVGSQQKLKLVNEIIPENEARSILRQTYFKIKLALPKEYKDTLLDIPEFSFNEKYYGITLPINITDINYIENPKIGDVFSGEIVGVLGQTLLLINEKAIFALSTNKFKGYKINLENELQHNNISNTPKIIKVKQKCDVSNDLFS